MSQIELPGRFNFITSGFNGGVTIDMTIAEAVTFSIYTEAGNQVVTLTELDDGAGEQALPVIDTLYKSPGVGGVWTKVTQTASNTYTHSDGTNDNIVLTVRADELSPGYNQLKILTANINSAVAVLHNLHHAKNAPGLTDPI